MTHHFMIGLNKVTWARDLGAIMAHVRSDERIAVLSSGFGSIWLVFCASPESAAAEKECFAMERKVGARCVLEVREGSIDLRTDCDDASLERVKEMVRFVFDCCNVTRVLEVDSGRDLTALVRHMPDALF